MAAPELTDFEQDLKDQILEEMGKDIVEVEMEELDKKWESIFASSKRWLRKFYTQKKYLRLPIPSSRKFLLDDLDPDFKTVSFIVLSGTRNLSQLGLNQFFSDLPLGSGFFTSDFNHSMYTQFLSELESRRKSTGTNPDYIIDDQFLYLTPASSSLNIGSKALICITLKTINSEKIEPPWDDYYFRRLAAETKKYVGRYRSKFGRVPTPQGDTELDGKDLLDESAKEIEDLRVEIAEDRPGDPIFLF